MSFIGLQLPETIDILGRTLALTPLTLAVLIGLPLLWGLWLWYWFGSRPAASSQVHHTSYHPQEEPAPLENYEPYYEPDEPASPIHYFDLSKSAEEKEESSSAQDGEEYTYEDRPDSDFYDVIQPALIPSRNQKQAEYAAADEPKMPIDDRPDLKEPPDQLMDRVSLN